MSEAWERRERDRSGLITYSTDSPLSCRICGYGLTNATFMGLKDRKPDTGSVSICADCGELSIFQISPLGQVSLLEPTMEELATIRRDPKTSRLLAAAAVARSRGWRPSA